MTLPAYSDRIELARAWQHSSLASLDPSDAEAFDRGLLTQLRKRTTPRFFFELANVQRIASDIATDQTEQTQWVIDRADQILAHRFPSKDSAFEDYTSQLPDEIDWYHNPTDEPHFIYTINRHRFWAELAMAFRFSGRRSYLDELQRQIVSWCEQSPPLASPDDWQKSRAWHLLDAAIRADTWIWTLFLSVTAEEWQPEINTLFVHRLLLHGRFLRHLTPRSGTYWAPNWLIMQAQGLLNIALMFPEFDESAAWIDHATDTLRMCLESQFRPDGSHCEQSPIYNEACLRWLAEPLYLARMNGCGGSADQCWLAIEKASEFIYQLSMPDGTLPALSDSDRHPAGVLTQLGLFFNRPEWMRFQPPSARDQWFLGGVVTEQTRSSPPPRPTAIAFPDAGYYVMRSGDSTDSLELVFDCGVHGLGHGHYDLLSFDLYGYGKPLIADPGRLIYADTPERAWVMSTPSHNTISLDGQNHARIESDEIERIHVTEWNVSAESIQVSGWHDGYRDLAGKPRVGRTIWFDRRSLFVIADWVLSDEDHEATVSFTVPGADLPATVSDGRRTSVGHGNVSITPLLQANQTADVHETFYSPNYGVSDPAMRLTVSERTKCSVFTAIIMAFDQPEYISSPAVTHHSVDHGIINLRIDGSHGPADIRLNPPFQWI